MGIYLENKYLNMSWIYHTGGPFTFVVGARGTGKTYGGYDVVLDENINFLYTRRRKNEAEMICNLENNPIIENIKDRRALGAQIDITIKSINDLLWGYYYADEDGRPCGAPFGYLTGFNTISKMRGFSFSNVDLWLYDEFIGEDHDLKIKNEGKAFLNAYETINRNRELKGAPPLKCICMANSNELANPIFMQLGIVGVAEKMANSGSQYYNDPSRGITIIMPSGSKISEAKKQTALYKASEGSGFADMAIENKFEGYTADNVAPQPLGEYKPLAFVGELGIYRHKSARRFYVCAHKAGAAREYRAGDDDLKRARHDLYYMRLAFLNNRVFFDSYLNKVLFTKYLDI